MAKQVDNKDYPIDQAALAFKILDGKASWEERQAFDRWLSQDQRHWEEFADLKLLWENSQGNGSEEGSNAFEKIKKLVEQRRRRKRLIHLLIYSACILALAVLIYMIASHFFLETRRGKLRFDNATVSAVIDQVQRAYEIKIECDERILDCRFTGVFYGDQDVDTIVSSIALALNAHVERQPLDTFRLTGSGCSGHSR